MKKLAKKTWLYVTLALVIGLVAGGLATRWHYKNLYKDSVTCESSKFYDKTGKTILYTIPACNR